jgi:hypothetical protein
MADLKSTRRGGYYWDGETPYVSVTTILNSVLPKDALMYWYGQEVYRAMVINPSQSEKEALGAPYKKSQKAMSIGTTVHSIVEAYKATHTEIPQVGVDFQKYANAFYEWARLHQPEILFNEKSVLSLKHGYQGTLDLMVKIQGETYLIDVKTGKDIYPSVELQLSAYQEALKENGINADKLAVLLLEKGKDGEGTGNYVFKTITPRFDEFLAAKKLWAWLNIDKNKKYGYKGGSL